MSLWPRRWWWLAFALACCLIVPFGLVLVMFLSDGAYEAIREMGRFFVSEEFRWATGLGLGWLAGSGVMAWVHRRAPRLQGPPLSEQAMALARDPDKQLQAIHLYRQETGVGLAVATDVVEAYSASERRRPKAPRQKLGAMEWMYIGFATAWYVALGSVFVLSFHARTNHFLTALALFLFIPGIFGGLCGICGEFVRGRVKDALQIKVQSGALTRRYAFGAGLVAGVASIAGVLVMGYTAFSLSHGEASVVIALVGIGAVLTAAPFLGFWLLNRKSAFPPHN
jgi:hypothetical protein